MKCADSINYADDEHVDVGIEPSESAGSAVSAGTNRDNAAKAGDHLAVNRRKSCNPCRTKKRKCDGDGVNPCSRCTKKGYGHQCTYSERRPRKPNMCQGADAFCAGTAQSMYSTADVRVEATGTAVAGALSRGGARSLKRYRLSASPATGLVGMRESALLRDYFCCVGFLPLVTQSHIREGMVRIMTASSVKSSRLEHDGYDKQQEKHAATAPSENAKGAIGTDGGGGDSALTFDSSTCMFWCAVALGMLVQGRSIESVSNYLQLAQHALASASGAPTIEAAKAWGMMAYVYGFCGDLERFTTHLEQADALLRESGEYGSNEGVPLASPPTEGWWVSGRPIPLFCISTANEQGFDEVLRQANTCKLLCGEVSVPVMGSLCSEELPPPQIPEIATEIDLYRYVMHFYRSSAQAFYGDVYEQVTAMRAGSGDGGRSSDNLQGFLDGNDSLERVVLSGDKVASVPGSAGAMMSRLREDSCKFELLERAGDLPSIRQGIGGIMINGMLFFAKNGKRDAIGALERLSHCIDVFARFPGLFRFSLGLHISHILMCALVAAEAPGSQILYGKLRAAYNSMRPAGSTLISPLEQWQGISAYCDHLYCRTLERLIALTIRPEEEGTPTAGACTTAATSPLGVNVNVYLEAALEHDVDVCRDAAGHCVKKSDADWVAQSAEALLLSELDGQGTISAEAGEVDALAVEDWLDVTHAMLDL